MKFKNETRGGFPVRIYATDGIKSYPVHGAINIDGAWISAAWTADGKCHGGQPEEYLIPLREPSEAAVEAAMDAWITATSVMPNSERIRTILRAAYEIDGIGGGE